MYLGMLNNEKKHLFLDLEIYMCQIDGDFSDEERNIINAHCMEMRIDNNNFKPELLLDELLSKLQSELSEREKRIVFFELSGTVLADNVYHKSERKLMERLAEILEVDQNNLDKAVALIHDLKGVYSRCAEYIG